MEKLKTRTRWKKAFDSVKQDLRENKSDDLKFSESQLQLDQESHVETMEEQTELPASEIWDSSSTKSRISSVSSSKTDFQAKVSKEFSETALIPKKVDTVTYIRRLRIKSDYDNTPPSFKIEFQYRENISHNRLMKIKPALVTKIFDVALSPSVNINQAVSQIADQIFNLPANKTCSLQVKMVNPGLKQAKNLAILCFKFEDVLDKLLGQKIRNLGISVDYFKPKNLARQANRRRDVSSKLNLQHNQPDDSRKNDRAKSHPKPSHDNPFDHLYPSKTHLLFKISRATDFYELRKILCTSPVNFKDSNYLTESMFDTKSKFKFSLDRYELFDFHHFEMPMVILTKNYLALWNFIKLNILFLSKASETHKYDFQNVNHLLSNFTSGRSDKFLEDEFWLWLKDLSLKNYYDQRNFPLNPDTFHFEKFIAKEIV